MNCLFLLVLLSCCGNCSAGRFGLGSSCPVQGSDECGCMRERREERRGEREDRRDNRREERETGCCERVECSCERGERGREQEMRSGSNNRRGEFADSVPGMNRSVMNGYAAYQDGCGCSD